MNTRLLFVLLWLTPFLCQSASFTSYFLNIEAITNSVARNEMRALTSVFTNSTTVNGSLITGVANPSGLIGMSAVNGVATTLQRTDSRQAIDPAIDPTWTGSHTFAPTSSDAGIVVTNSATTQIGVTINGFSGQTNDVFRAGSGGTNYVKMNGRGGLDITKVGTAADPALVFSGVATNSGFFSVQAGTLSLAMAGNERFKFWGGTASLYLLNNSAVIALGTTSDVQLSWKAANVLRVGPDAASTAAQTIQGPDGSGSNIAGGALRVDGGYSTGTAAAGGVIFRTANSAGGTSSSLNTPSERFHAPAKWVTLTSATATTIFTVPVPLTNYVGLTATVTIYATDGTDHQSKTSVITCDAINKAGAITETLTQVDNTTATSSGTLTATYDSVDAGSNVLGIRVAADSSLSETVLRAKIVITAINSNGSAAVTEQ